MSAQVRGGSDRLGIRAPSGSGVYIEIAGAKKRAHPCRCPETIPSVTGELPHLARTPSRKGGLGVPGREGHIQKHTKSDRGEGGAMFCCGGFVPNASRKPRERKN